MTFQRLTLLPHDQNVEGSNPAPGPGEKAITRNRQLNLLCKEGAKCQRPNDTHMTNL